MSTGVLFAGSHVDLRMDTVGWEFRSCVAADEGGTKQDA